MPLTNVKQPGNGLWNCCKEKPTDVIQYDNGAATVACRSCAGTYERHHGSEWIFPLPVGWLPPGVAELARRLAENAREYHEAIAFNDDVAVSGGNSGLYKNSSALFKAAIANAYPELGYGEIYDVWLDCNESVEYCARFVAERRAHDAAQELFIDDSNGRVVVS